MNDQKPRKLSDMGSPIEYAKVRDHIGETFTCMSFEFFDGQYGESYNMLCASSETGEMCRFTGKHKSIMDRLQYGYHGGELPTPFEFQFVDNGTDGKHAYSIV